MSDLTIQAMQWEETPDIDQVPAFSEKDQRCFREIRDILVRYEALDRFGLMLIHKHFAIADDELLMEFTDHETRTNTVRPIRRSEVEGTAMTVTTWKLTADETVALSGCRCAKNIDGHFGRHESF